MISAPAAAQSASTAAYPPSVVPVRIETEEPGPNRVVVTTALREVECTAPCSLRLEPGTYPVRVFGEGWRYRVFAEVPAAPSLVRARGRDWGRIGAAITVLLFAGAGLGATGAAAYNGGVQDNASVAATVTVFGAATVAFVITGVMLLQGTRARAVISPLTVRPTARRTALELAGVSIAPDGLGGAHAVAGFRF